MEPIVIRFHRIDHQYAVLNPQGEEETVETPEGLHAALARRAGQLAVWDDRRIVCLDVDAHGPAPAIPLSAAEIQPTPITAYTSSGGSGLHGWYMDGEDVTAQELASAAAIWAHEHFAAATGIELRDRVRIGLVPGPLFSQGAAMRGTSWTARGYLTVADEEVAEWRREHGYEEERYDHDRCPFHPGEKTGNPPVRVEPDGIRCFKSSCNRFVPWAVLLGHDITLPIEEMARAAVWVHHAATWIGAKKSYPKFSAPQAEWIIRSAYSLLVKGYWPDGNPKARHLGYGKGDTILRDSSGLLRNAAWSPLTRKDAETFLAGVSVAADYYREEDEWKRARKPNMEMYTRILYYNRTPSIPPVEKTGTFPWSLRIRERREPDTAFIDDPAHSYIDAARRMPEEDCWREIERHFPGVERPLLTGILIASGVASCGVQGQPPVMLLHGVSSGGKTTLGKVASVLCGSRQCACDIKDGGQEFDRIIRPAVLAGVPVVIVDEASAGAKTANRVATRILSLQSPWETKVLYGESISITLRSAFLLTTVSIPEEWRLAQIDRRCAVWHVAHRVDWSAARDAGVLQDWFADRRRADAANGLCSWLVDRYFALDVPPNWERTLEGLGWQRLMDAREAEGAAEEFEVGLREVIKLGAQREKKVVCGNPGAVELKLENLEVPGTLEHQLHALLGTSPNEPDNLFPLDRVAERDLGATLHVEWDVYVRVWRRGRKYYMRVNANGRTAEGRYRQWGEVLGGEA